MSIVGTVSRVTSFSRLVVFCVLFFTPSCSFWLVWLNPDEKKNKKEKNGKPKMQQFTFQLFESWFIVSLNRWKKNSLKLGYQK